MEENVLIIKYGEVAMRGNNMRLFINRIIDSIRKNVDQYGNFYVEKEQGRLILVDKNGQMDYDLVIPKIIPIFGIHGVCPGIKTTDQSYENIKKLCLEHMKEHFGDKETTFKVIAKRANKKYPMESPEIMSGIGEFLLNEMPNLKVDVHNYEVELRVELRNDAYIYSKMIPGFGGLPIGSSGKGISLLSGGIDSPVATWMMAKRGIEVSGIYFNSPPYTSERAKQKVVDLAEQISLYTGGFKLYVVPFTELQLYLLENVPHDKLTVFLKRAMMKTAQKLAEETGCHTLITGDSVGQVASQTLHAIHAINDPCHIPVLRPLAGMDKQEIVDIARKIGTFDISIRPYEDCCTIFVAKHPETKPKTSVINRIESKLDKLDELLEKAYNEMEIIEV